MSDRAIRELMSTLHDLPEGVEGQLVAQRIRQRFTHELDDKRQFFAADYDDAVAIVVLEDDRAALYRFRAPHTVSRELLNLGGTSVRTEHELGDDPGTHLSIELHNGGRLRVRPSSLAGFTDLDDLRVELEKRAMRLGHY